MAGSDGAILEARRLVAEEPERWAYLDQYSNPENWRAHYRTTGPEIWEQTGGSDHPLRHRPGHQRHFHGRRALPARAPPAVRLISVEPDSPFHGLEGMKHMASAIVPPIYDPALADEARELATERAYGMVKRLAREMGLLVGDLLRRQRRRGPRGGFGAAHAACSSPSSATAPTSICPTDSGRSPTP